MKLSEWAKVHNLSYQTVWRWFKNGKLPVKAKQMPSGQILVEEDDEETEKFTENTGEKDFTISKADLETFKLILNEAQADKDYKIITHGNVIIEKNSNQEILDKLDELIIGVNKITTFLFKNENTIDKEKLKQELIQSFSDTQLADMFEENNTIAEKAREENLVNYLKEIENTKKEKTEKLNKKEKATNIKGKSVGFIRADNLSLQELFSLGIERLNKAEKAEKQYEEKNIEPFISPNELSFIKEIIQKINKEIGRGRLTEEESKQYNRLKEWVQKQQSKIEKLKPINVTIEETQKLFDNKLTLDEIEEIYSRK